MSIKRLTVLIGAASLIATVGLAQTAPQAGSSPWLATVMEELAAAGYGQFEIETEGNQVEVEARNGADEIERYYSLDGTLLREEFTVNGVETERYFDADGNVIREEIDRDDD